VARFGLILRKRLGGMLVAGNLPKLVLVTAPAGYGKTTLLAQYFDLLGRKDYHCVWFSVDRSDSEPAEFLRYLINALQTEIADLGEESLRKLESRSQVDPDEIVVGLINEIAATAQEIVIFLDDFHHAESGTVTQIIRTFIAHGPWNLHFLLASRTLPALSVASLRAHAEVVDITTEDLRFSALESTQFLRDARGLDLSDAQIDTLFRRTEGWVAGLQLASLSLHQSGRRDELIQSFSGKAREVAEYLALDVLNGFPQDIQVFLLYTSILERMSSESCQYLVGRDDCQDVLDQLEVSTFLLPLDQSRTWYRYQHLFREFLLSELQRRFPAVIDDLYKQASLWFAEQHFDNEAVSYALESGDSDRAALLVEQQATRLLQRGQMPRLYNWLSKLPETIIERRPRLPMLRCWALFHMNQPKEAAQALHQAQHIIASLKDSARGETGEELAALQEEMKVLRAGVACARDDVEKLGKSCERAIARKIDPAFSPGCHVQHAWLFASSER